MKIAAALAIAAMLASCGVTPRDHPLPSVPADTGSGTAVITTDHVQLVTTLPDGPLRRDLPALLEKSVASFIAMTPGGPEPVIEVRFFDTELAWRLAVQDFARRRLGKSLTLGAGLSRAGVTIDGTSFLFDIGGRDALRLAAHEAWHAYAHAAFDAPLPVWLDEALACRAEGFYWAPGAGEPILAPTANPTRRAQARDMVSAGRLGSLEDHLRADPSGLTHSRRALDDYYARAWLLGLTLDEPDLADRLAVALARASRGTLPAAKAPDSVAHILGITPVELEARWRDPVR